MSTDQDCVTGCGRPAGDVFLCRSCADDLTHWLSTVDELTRELIITTTRRARLGDPVAVTSQGPPPLPYDPHASEAADILADTLNAWVGDLAQRTGHSRHTASSAPEMALWLRQRTHVMRTHPEASMLTDEITHAIRHGWASVDRPPGRAYIGPCGAITPEGHCPMDLYARADPARPGRLDPRQSVIRCPECGTGWDAGDRRDWLFDQLRGTLATAREIASAAGMIAGKSINVKTVRSWADRGLIACYPTPGGPPRFRVGEVIDRAVTRAR